MPDVFALPVADLGSLERWLPELLLIVTFVVTLPLSLFERGRLPGLARLAAIAGLVLATIAAVLRLNLEPAGVLGTVVVIDPLAALVQVLVIASALGLVLLGSRRWRGRAAAHELPAAVLPFLALHALVLCVVASVQTIPGIIIGVMGLAVMGALVAGLAARPVATRAAALRYGVASAAGAAVAVYALSLLYPLAGSGDLAAVSGGLLAVLPQPAPIAVIFVLLALGLTVLAVTSPLTWRRPQSAAVDLPPMVIGYLSTAPMLAVLVLMWRLVRALAGAGGDAGLTALQRLLPWPELMSALAVAAMAIGTVLALRQTRITAILAWLSLAQAGYGLLALCARPGALLAPVLLHLGAFAAANLGAFALVQAVVHDAGHDGRENLAGWGRRRFWSAAVLAVFLMSLAGMPPTVGFVARVRLLAALVEVDHLGLAVTVAVLSLLAALGYLRVVMDLFRPVPPDATVAQVRLGPLQAVTLVSLAAATLIGGAVWKTLTALVTRAASGW